MKLFQALLLKYRQSVRFYKYLFSYMVVVMVILLVVGGAIYGSFFSTLQNEVESSNIASLMQVKDMIFFRLSEMERMTVQITGNKELRFSMVNSGGYDALLAMTELQKYNSANTFVHDVAIFYKNSNRITAASGSYTLDEFFETIYAYESFGKKEFLDIVSSIRTPVMRPVERVRQDSFATYIYPIPVNSTEPYGVVIFIINEKSLNSMINNILNKYSGFVYILDKNDNPIAAVESGQNSYPKDDMLNRVRVGSIHQAISTIPLGKEKYSVVKLKCDVTGWSYIIIIPARQFMQSVQVSRRIFGSMVAGVFVLGLALAVAFASSNYKPVKNLVKTIKGQYKNINLQKSTDEFALINNTLSEFANENKNLMHKLKSKSALMREQMFMNLLKGNIEAPEQLEALSDVISLKTSGSYYAVLIFLIDNYIEFKNNNSKSMQDLFKFSIINVIEELSSEIGSGYGLDLMNDYGIALVICMEQENRMEQCLYEIAFRAMEFFRQNFTFSLTVGIGGIQEDILMVHQSFIEANRAAHYRLIKGNNSIIFYCDIREMEENNKYKYPVELEADLLTAIKQGKGDDVESIIKEIARNIAGQNASLESVQIICSGIISSVVKILDELDITDLSYKEDGVEIDLTSNFETIKEFEKRMIDFGKRVCLYVEDKKQSKNFGLTQKIFDYVNERYTNNGITLEMIAEEFNISASYITRFFKDQTGDSLMRYIDKKRMDRAKELLKNTELKLSDIVEQCGYVDKVNFIRKFKKYESITPMQYRSITKRKLAKASPLQGKHKADGVDTLPPEKQGMKNQTGE